MNSGIYAILNLVNGKYYIGSAIDFTDRFRLHMLELNRNNHHNRHLQKAWNKHGQTNFKFVILEETDNLLEREQFAIEGMNATDRHKGYNICAVSRNRQGVKASDETKEKLRLSHLGHKQSEETKVKRAVKMKGNTINNGRKWDKETIDKRAKSNTGEKRSAEAIARMKLSCLNKKPVSNEAKLNMSIAARKRAQRKRENDNKPLDYTCDMWV